MLRTRQIECRAVCTPTASGSLRTFVVINNYWTILFYKPSVSYLKMYPRKITKAVMKEFNYIIAIATVVEKVG